MTKGAKKKVGREEGRGSLVLGLAEVIRSELREFVIGAGMAALYALLERDRTTLCGPRYAHDATRTARRAGHAPGELVMGGRRVAVTRPRVRSVDGDELALPTWAQFAAEDPLHARAVAQMLVGVSTRKYGRSLEPLAPEVRTRGTSKSAVSRRFVATTQTEMESWLTQDLAAFDLAALMVDGIVIAGHTMLVALGIDASGTKRVLGVHEGATENATCCKALLADLAARGMRTDRTILVVIDGSKALASAVRATFQTKAVIQRCQVHKLRNVRDHLPEAARESVARAMRQAYGCGDAARALKLLRGLERRLKTEHPGAAGSLAEGLEETLTVMAFKLPRMLERVLSTTNAIENLMGSVRALADRVKRWRGGAMIERWTVTALVEASRHFRRLRGCTGMAKLVAALRARDRDTTKPLEPLQQVA